MPHVSTCNQRKLRFSGASALPLPVDVDDDSGNDDQSFDDFLVIGPDLKEGEARRHHAEDDRADDRACDATDAAGQRGAADHHRGDRVQRVDATDRRRGFARVGDEGQQQPADGRQQPATA